MTTVKPRLGVDFGRVIQGAALPEGGADTTFLAGGDAEAMRTPPSDGAFAALARLVSSFDGQAWVISKCGPRVQQRTRQWLEHHDFYRQTGVPRGNLRFCRKRADKAKHCAELHITHMIDDRLEVHEALQGLVPELFLFGVQSGPVPRWVHHIPSWSVAEAVVIDTLPPHSRPRG